MKAEDVKAEIEKNKDYLEMAISVMTKEERICVLEHIKEYVKIKSERGEYDETRKMLVNQILDLLSKVKVNSMLRKMVLMNIGLIKKDNRIKSLIEKVKDDEFGFTQCSEVMRKIRDE
ncbi:MAG: hypothetical protein QW478_04200 [Candidatus Micrarchaeaceae archaeon]